MGMGIHAYGGYAHAWGAYGHGHMIAWVYVVGLTQDINSYACMQHAGMAQVEASKQINVNIKELACG